MAHSPAAATPRAESPRWWQALPEKMVVAAATASATMLGTTGLPAAKNWWFHEKNDTASNQQEVQAQQAMWMRNGSCGIVNETIIWHDSHEGRKVDATICPGTGDILVVMRDLSGRSVQWWADMAPLESQFKRASEQQQAGLRNLIEGRAMAAIPRGEAAPASSQGAVGAGGFSAGTRLAQTVLCQAYLPDGRRLRRRLSTGPNQCTEIMIDTFTGAVLYQRPAPCVPSCTGNA